MERAQTHQSSSEHDAARQIPVVTAQLLVDLKRWEEELARFSLTRVTLWAGVYAKAFKAFEFLMKAATGYWISAAGGSGQDVVRDVSRKPVDRLTVGQQLEILRRLSMQSTLFAQNCTSWRGDLDVLARLVKRRNEFAHGRLSYDDRDAEAVRALFADLRTLCKSPIVTDVTTASVP